MGYFWKTLISVFLVESQRFEGADLDSGDPHARAGVRAEYEPGPVQDAPLLCDLARLVY